MVEVNKMIFYQQHENDFSIVECATMYFPPHLHKQIEIMACFEGKMKVTCDFHTYELKSGDWLIVLPECEHSYVETENFKGAMMIFNPALISHLSLYFKKKLCIPVIHESDSLRRECLLRLLNIKGQFKSEAVVKGYLYVIVGSLFEKCNFWEREVSGESVVQNVLDYLSRHFTEEITRYSLAGQFGLSSSYLSHLFQNKLGCSFLKYLHTLRIDYAKYLLKNSDKTITEICYESGFSTQRSFNRVFLQMAGCTPGEYRNESL